jgi:hypothetical protein
MSASPPRLSSSLQGSLPVVYLKEILKWSHHLESKQTMKNQPKLKNLGTKFYCLVLKKNKLIKSLRPRIKDLSPTTTPKMLSSLYTLANVD